MIRIRAFGHFPLPDRGIALQFFIHIIQIRTAASRAASAAGAASLSPAHVHSLRLIQIALFHTIFAKRKAVLHSLQRQIDTPVIPVHGDFRIVIKGRIHAKIPVHVIDNGFLAVRGIRIIIVENQLIQPLTGLPLHISVKFQFKAVTVIVRIHCYGRETGVALRSYSHIIICSTVNRHVTRIIRLAHGVLQHFLPVILLHDNVYLHDTFRVKKPGFIFHCKAGR